MSQQQKALRYLHDSGLLNISTHPKIWEMRLQATKKKKESPSFIIVDTSYEEICFASNVNRRTRTSLILEEM